MPEESNDLPDNLNEDEFEDLSIENELLKLKLQAETGAVFGGSENLSPEMENDFLRHVQMFEDAWRNVQQAKVYDLIGNPSYIVHTDLNDQQIKEELEKLFVLLETNDIDLDVLGEYEPRVIYRFITEEFFQHQTDDIQLPGMTKNFIYEEFHPNHKMDIHKGAERFLNNWFAKSFTEFDLELGNTFLLPDGSSLSKEVVLQKFEMVFESYSSFLNCRYAIPEVSFEWDDENNTGLGHADGGVQYDAVLENGETVPIEGPFKLYFSNENGLWRIFYFVLPGFSF